MTYLIGRSSGSGIRSFTAGARRLLRVATIAAVLAVATHPAATSAAEPGTAMDLAGGTPVPAFNASSVIGCMEQTAVLEFESDYDEDRFDEGDDEFDCDTVVDGEHACSDDGEDRIDEGDDEYPGTDPSEAGCAKADDGEARRVDEGKDRFDEGDDEFGTRPEPIASRPEPIVSRPAAAASAVPMDLSAPGALAALVGLGAGGLWLLRRTRV